MYDNGPFASQSTDTLKARTSNLPATERSAIPAVERGSKSVAGKTLEATYFGNLAAHAAIEPMNATASVTSDGVDLAPTQVQTIAQASAAKIAGVTQTKCRFTRPISAADLVDG